MAIIPILSENDFRYSQSTAAVRARKIYGSDYDTYKSKSILANSKEKLRLENPMEKSNEIRIANLQALLKNEKAKYAKLENDMNSYYSSLPSTGMSGNQKATLDQKVLAFNKCNGEVDFLSKSLLEALFTKAMYFNMPPMDQA